jgi:7-cyano-7-deazaguanine synthase in queuosine biosynthesis
MSHHTIYCHLGPGDAVPVATPSAGTVLSLIDFVDDAGNLGFGLGSVLAQLDSMGLAPSEIAVDLAVLATALTAADTRISRSATAQDRWTREIDLDTPVSDVALWRGQQELLEATLRFLTGDRWGIRFHARPAGHATLVRPTENLRTAFPTTVCLLSGGLDSFIGAVDLLSEGEDPLFVSHWWDTLTRNRQLYCLTQLQNRFAGRGFRHLSANVGFDHQTVTSSGIEDTLRGRSFLFFAMATLAATAIGGHAVIHAPENGLISLNVPLDPLRLGALSTRTTHPYYMARFNELLGRLGLSARLHNPYRHQTKGQMVQGCRDKAFLRRHAHHTMSCSGPGKYRFHPDEAMRKVQHCGHCVPCLIRRASLLAGFGAGGDSTPYTVDDLKARVLDSDRAEGEHIRAFKLALARLEAEPARARRDIHIPGPLIDHAHELVDYEAVYTQGMQEVAQMLVGVEARPSS